MYKLTHYGDDGYQGIAQSTNAADPTRRRDLFGAAVLDVNPPKPAQIKSAMTASGIVPRTMVGNTRRTADVNAPLWPERILSINMNPVGSGK
jgi:hypothetical protein